VTGLLYARDAIIALLLVIALFELAACLDRRDEALAEPGEAHTSRAADTGRNTDERRVARGSRSLHVPGSASVYDQEASGE